MEVEADVQDRQNLKIDVNTWRRVLPHIGSTYVISAYVYVQHIHIHIHIYMHPHRCTPNHTIPYLIISYHIISYHIISYHIVWYSITFYHVISCHILPDRLVPYHTHRDGCSVQAREADDIEKEASASYNIAEILLRRPGRRSV